MNTTYSISQAMQPGYKDAHVARVNRTYLFGFCREHNLVIKKGEDAHRFIIATSNGENVGVISVWPSNNGKFYAYRANCLGYWASKATFENFASAVEAITRFAI